MAPDDAAGAGPPNERGPAGEGRGLFEDQSASMVERPEDTPIDSASQATKQLLPLVTGPIEPERFDWVNDDSVICSTQPAFAIYWNEACQVAIRQEGQYPDPDVVVVFNPESLPRLIGALQRF